MRTNKIDREDCGGGCGGGGGGGGDAGGGGGGGGCCCGGGRSSSSSSGGGGGGGGSCGPGSSVGIANDYGLDGPGSNPAGDGIFRPSRPALGPTERPVQWEPGLSRGKVQMGRAADHSLLVTRPWNSRSIPLPTLWATPGL